MPNLVIIFGPPASGKAAIGHALAARTGYRFFHNHLTADPVAALFGYGSGRFNRMVDAVRNLLFAEAAKDKSISGIVFTFVWNIELPEDKDFIQRTAELFEQQGGRIYFVELHASLHTRIQREGTEFRVNLKPALRDVEAARNRQTEMDSKYRMNTIPDAPIPWPHLRVNTETIEAQNAAVLIQQTFGLPSIDA